MIVGVVGLGMTLVWSFYLVLPQDAISRFAAASSTASSGGASSGALAAWVSATAVWMAPSDGAFSVPPQAAKINSKANRNIRVVLCSFPPKEKLSH